MISSLRRQPKQQRSRERVDLILDAAADLLAQVGPGGTTITAVSEATGLATSSIYTYVEDDRRLIGAVLERGLELIRQTVIEIVGNPATLENFVEALSVGTSTYINAYRTQPGLREALAFAEADPELAGINLADTRRNTATILAALEPLVPDVDHSHAALLLTHFAGALASLVATVDEQEAASLIVEFRRLVWLALTND